MFGRRHHSRSGAGHDLVSTVLTPRAISDALGWCSVMAYIWWYGAPGHSRRLTTAPDPAPGLISVMAPAATAALMMWCRQ